MTVKELIKKLQGVPESAIVSISNDDMFAVGEYKVTGVEYCSEDCTVEIVTDYEEMVWEE